MAGIQAPVNETIYLAPVLNAGQNSGPKAGIMGGTAAFAIRKEKKRDTGVYAPYAATTLSELDSILRGMKLEDAKGALISMGITINHVDSYIGHEPKSICSFTYEGKRNTINFTWPVDAVPGDFIIAGHIFTRPTKAAFDAFCTAEIATITGLTVIDAAVTAFYGDNVGAYRNELAPYARVSSPAPANTPIAIGTTLGLVGKPWHERLAWSVFQWIGIGDTATNEIQAVAAYGHVTLDATVLSEMIGTVNNALAGVAQSHADLMGSMPDIGTVLTRIQSCRADEKALIMAAYIFTVYRCANVPVTAAVNVTVAIKGHIATALHAMAVDILEAWGIEGGNQGSVSAVSCYTIVSYATDDATYDHIGVGATNPAVALDCHDNGAGRTADDARDAAIAAIQLICFGHNATTTADVTAAAEACVDAFDLGGGAIVVTVRDAAANGTGVSVGDHGIGALSRLPSVLDFLHGEMCRILLHGLPVDARLESMMQHDGVITAFASLAKISGARPVVAAMNAVVNDHTIAEREGIRRSHYAARVYACARAVVAATVHSYRAVLAVLIAAAGAGAGAVPLEVAAVNAAIAAGGLDRVLDQRPLDGACITACRALRVALEACHETPIPGAGFPGAGTAAQVLACYQIHILNSSAYRRLPLFVYCLGVLCAPPPGRPRTIAAVALPGGGVTPTGAFLGPIADKACDILKESYHPSMWNRIGHASEADMRAVLNNLPPVYSETILMSSPSPSKYAIHKILDPFCK